MTAFEQENPEQQKQAQCESAIFAAELGGRAPEVDLHGMDTIEALEAVDRFLHLQFMAGERVAKIVHGRGSGKLREVVHQLLKSHTLVEYYRDAQAPHSLAGVTYAVLGPKE